mgnify:CR=1 FL=1
MIMQMLGHRKERTKEIRTEEIELRDKSRCVHISYDKNNPSSFTIKYYDSYRGSNYQISSDRSSNKIISASFYSERKRNGPSFSMTPTPKKLPEHIKRIVEKALSEKIISENNIEKSVLHIVNDINFSPFCRWLIRERLMSFTINCKNFFFAK